MHAERHRRPEAALGLAVLGIIALLAALSGCGEGRGPAVADIADGAWMGAAGPEQYYFDIQRDEAGALSGIIHIMRDGKKRSEMPIARVTWNPPDLELYMGATDVTYRGQVSLEQGRVDGALHYTQYPSTEMDLRWANPDAVPGLRARSAPVTGEPLYVYTRPDPLDDGWETADPEAVGLDREAIEGLVAAILGGEAGLLHSILIVKSGRLVVEEYFHGYGREDVHRLASVTKSISSLLVGLALDQGRIGGVDAPLCDFFPQCADLRTPDWERVTLRHLLTMSLGLDWSDEEAEQIHGTGDEFFRQVLGRRFAAAPGERWRYVNADVNLLSGVILQATGLYADVYAAQNLFAPLGITQWTWDYGERDGHRLMDGSLHLRPRDMAKLGALLLRDGRWRDTQVVSADWIRASTSLQIPTGQGPEGYGYLWWRQSMPTPSGMRQMIFANGWGSQFIAVFPELDVLVVTTGGNEDNGRHFAIGKLLGQEVIARL